MEIDRNVSEYMQKRNILACNVSRVLAAQTLVVAVFFYAYYVLQNWKSRVIPLSSARFAVKCVLVILSALIAIAGCIITCKIGDMVSLAPDAPGLRQSREIIEYAYGKAKDVLIFKITVSAVMLTVGVVAALIYATIVGYGEKATLIGSVISLFFLSIAILTFLPSFDRINTYKTILGIWSNIDNQDDGDVKRIINLRTAYLRVVGNTLSVLLPSSVCIYLMWRYFGSNRQMSFIVFPIAILVLCAVCALSGKQNRA